MKRVIARVIALASALVLGALAFAVPASAQYNQPVPGPYGAEDGYNDDEFGWGPAYRPETNFRPFYGFYGGVERPYPYARYAPPAYGRPPGAAPPRHYGARPALRPRSAVKRHAPRRPAARQVQRQ